MFFVRLAFRDAMQRLNFCRKALQCGICTPGFLVAAKALLDRNPDPTEEEIRYALAGNLCRCTGYDKIVRAVDAAAKDIRKQQRGAKKKRPSRRASQKTA